MQQGLKQRGLKFAGAAGIGFLALTTFAVGRSAGDRGIFPIRLWRAAGRTSRRRRRRFARRHGAVAQPRRPGPRRPPVAVRRFDLHALPQLYGDRDPDHRAGKIRQQAECFCHSEHRLQQSDRRRFLLGLRDLRQRRHEYQLAGHDQYDGGLHWPSACGWRNRVCTAAARPASTSCRRSSRSVMRAGSAHFPSASRRWSLFSDSRSRGLGAFAVASPQTLRISPTRDMTMSYGGGVRGGVEWSVVPNFRIGVVRPERRCG